MTAQAARAATCQLEQPTLQVEQGIPVYYFCCVCFSLLVNVVRPGEIFLVLAIARLALMSFALTALAFLACSGPQWVQRMAPAGAGLMKFLLFLGFVGIAFSVWPRYSLENWQLMLIRTLSYFFWLPAVGSSAGLRRVVIVLTLCAACLVLLMLFVNVIGVTGRVSVGVSYDPNDIAMVLATLFPFAAHLFLQGGLRAKLLCGALMGGIMLSILNTGSRGGLLALGVASILLVFAAGTAVKTWHKLFVIVLVAGFIMSPAADTVKNRWQDVFSGKDYNLDGTKGGRLETWKDTLQLIAKHPLTGIGIGNSSTAMGMEYRRWRATHNSYLQAGLELGVPGMIVFLLLLRTIWRNCREARRFFITEPDMRSAALLATCTRIALLTYMVGGFFLSQAYSIMVPVLLLISNGLAHASRTMIKTHDGLNYCEEQFVEGTQQG
jgi:O-antigen ligase